MLGLNAARYYYRIRMSGFTTVLGIIAIATGTAELLGYDLLSGALLLIILAAYILLKPYFPAADFAEVRRFSVRLLRCGVGRG